VALALITGSIARSASRR